MSARDRVVDLLGPGEAGAAENENVERRRCATDVASALAVRRWFGAERSVESGSRLSAPPRAADVLRKVRRVDMTGLRVGAVWTGLTRANMLPGRCRRYSRGADLSG